MIDLGMKVRDKITGLEGIVIARTEWLNGCERLTIQPEYNKEGKPAEAQTIDAAQLEVVGTKHPQRKLPPAPVLTGGPRDEPKRHPAPKRQ
jgi:hypothetical protein